MKHKYYDVIVAWAEGKTIQLRPILDEGWANFNSTITPDFDSVFMEWRIKPEIEIRKYRVALFRHPQGSLFTVTDDNENNERKREDQNGFVKWLTDWVDYEVEE